MDQVGFSEAKGKKGRKNTTKLNTYNARNLNTLQRNEIHCNMLPQLARCFKHATTNFHPPSPSKFTPFFSTDVVRPRTFCILLLGLLLFCVQIWVIRSSELRHHRCGNNKQTRKTNATCVPFDVFMFYHWERCKKVDHVRHGGFERMCCQVIFSQSIFCSLFWHCCPLAASQVTRRKDMKVLH